MTVPRDDGKIVLRRRSIEERARYLLDHAEGTGDAAVMLLRQVAEDLLAEVAAMRPVVEAATAWAEAPMASFDMPTLVRELVNAVRAYRGTHDG